MDADLEVAVFQHFEGQGVVVVLGVGRVDGEGQGVPEILAALEVLGRDLVGNGLGLVVDGFLETVRKAELRQDGVHLRFVLAGHAEHVHQVAVRGRVVAVPAVHDGGDFHAALRAQGSRFLRIHLDVVGHRLALHQHPGLGADGVVHADEGALRALDDLDDLAFLAPVASAFAGHGDDHRVSVEGLPGLGRLDEDVVVHAFDDDEDEAFAGHLDPAGVLRVSLGSLVAGAVVLVLGGSAFEAGAFSAHFVGRGDVVDSVLQR